MTDEEVWHDLAPDLQRELREEFAEDFTLRRGERPLIVPPAPAVTWDLAPAYAVGADRAVAQLVADVLRECTEYWESVIVHDFVHESVLYRPHRVTDAEDAGDWESVLLPNGDYLVFVAKDHSFGVVGDHVERSLCFFGVPAVAAARRLNKGVLTRTLREDIG
ncbi:DUF2716 domain-containing protein [Saccharothrix variisporea]|uniref:Uncharacterized protein DUF2716 n=1 Tax=Saccharothrix variisporea TaxID=543527 RepID=A0A495XHC5_9PSEU|nr:DUF2716 domain-containing protein [Saccharothrix variisporea]RKT72576.1 uncharacterized protein DUF2716 [Saccharothrix variisporea]